jgi:hypothetical protein
VSYDVFLTFYITVMEKFLTVIHQGKVAFPDSPSVTVTVREDYL